MNTTASLDTVVLIVVFLAIIVGVLVLAQVFRMTRSLRHQSVKGILRGEGRSYSSQQPGRRVQELKDVDVEHIKKITKYSGAHGGRRKNSIAQKLFRAGYYSPKYRRYFFIFQIVSLTLGASLVGFAVFSFSRDTLFLTLATILGVMIGLFLPLVWLDRKIEAREEDIRYFLPLVIEQISIGVSSALIIGTSIVEIIETADKRDAHNPVTELFVHAEKLVRSGMALEDSLMEVAEVCGMSEIQHAFMFLVQCSKHGGEVSKQLQDLADSISAERNVQVQARIAALPVKATGPLTFVFAGFFSLLMSGIVVRIGTALLKSGMGAG